MEILIEDGKGGMAVLSPEQFELVETIIVEMMNSGRGRRAAVLAAEQKIIQTLADAGLPLEFEE